MLRDNLGQDVNKGRLIPAGDHHIRLYEKGAGPPVVMIIAGAGDCADSWLPVRHHLAADHRVVSYDRAAIGGSEQAAPATVDRYWTRSTVAASPRDPVILAGHSLGGLIARLYQHATYPAPDGRQAGRRPLQTEGAALDKDDQADGDQDHGQDDVAPAGPRLSLHHQVLRQVSPTVVTVRAARGRSRARWAAPWPAAADPPGPGTGR